MRVRAAQELAVQRPRQHYIVGVDGLPGDLGPAVDPGEWLPDNGESRLPAVAGRTGGGAQPAILVAAISTASRIFT